MQFCVRYVRSETEHCMLHVSCQTDSFTTTNEEIILISIHTIQCRTRQTEAEQYIQEEHIKYSKILI